MKEMMIENDDNRPVVDTDTVVIIQSFPNETLLNFVTCFGRCVVTVSTTVVPPREEEPTPTNVLNTNIFIRFGHTPSFRIQPTVSESKQGHQEDDYNNKRSSYFLLSTTIHYYSESDFFDASASTDIDFTWYSFYCSCWTLYLL